MQPGISLATARNWERLNVDLETRLTTRANKTMSKKTVIPVEYLSNKGSVLLINQIVDYVKYNNIEVFVAIYSVAKKLLLQSNILDNFHVQQTLDTYPNKVDNYLFSLNYPLNERDILGTIYQSISIEGRKNQQGSYYTPEKIVRNMTSWLSFENNEQFLDPCCGSGSFLIELNARPSQLFGIDNDRIAVFICKVNLLLKYKSEVFTPQIYCADFLDENSLYCLPIRNIQFDYIITNPPWGANCKLRFQEIVSNESFSLFFVKSFSLLNKHGKIRFLFPEALLNVKVHKDIRLFMLTHGNIESISLYDDTFTGVTTHYVDIEMSKKTDNSLINVYTSKKLFTVDKKSFYTTENFVFNFQNNFDIEIIQRVKKIGAYNLKNSIWALGIVTGDNKRKLLSTQTSGAEPIYTGKEIQPYCLRQCKNYIVYNRSDFQQVAKDEYYRAAEKLVYKFISNKLVFAYDDSRSLFLNSANILIPNIPNMSIKTVMGFLNSELYQYLYSTLFSEIKILKGNLIELPFPKISSIQNDIITDYVQRIIVGEQKYIDKLQDVIYSVFDISEEQKKYIKGKVYGTFNK
ncbi:MAG: N-6 DNA methylase [Clostridia bacterium]|nr:N-6 DNA methylase [Clostridia bacterium]